jgi:hypothetical protein
MMYCTYIHEVWVRMYIVNFYASGMKFILMGEWLWCTPQTLYFEGARTVVVMDSFPRGCYPDQLLHATGPDEISEDGCYIPAMKIIERHNARLREMVRSLNAELPGANLIIFSLHDMFLSAIRNPFKFGELSCHLNYGLVMPFLPYRPMLLNDFF